MFEKNKETLFGIMSNISEGGGDLKKDHFLGLCRKTFNSQVCTVVLKTN